MSGPRLRHPDEREWIPHASSHQPVSDEAEVRVQFACGIVGKHEYRARQLNWKKRGQAFDVVAYQIVSTPGEG